MILGCDFIIALEGYFLAGKLGVIRVVTSQLGFTRAFSIRVLITRNVVPTVIGWGLVIEGIGFRVGISVGIDLGQKWERVRVKVVNC